MYKCHSYQVSDSFWCLHPHTVFTQDLTGVKWLNFLALSASQKIETFTFRSPMITMFQTVSTAYNHLETAQSWKLALKDRKLKHFLTAISFSAATWFNFLALSTGTQVQEICSATGHHVLDSFYCLYSARDHSKTGSYRTDIRTLSHCYQPSG